MTPYNNSCLDGNMIPQANVGEALETAWWRNNEVIILYLIFNESTIEEFWETLKNLVVLKIPYNYANHYYIITFHSTLFIQ